MAPDAALAPSSLTWLIVGLFGAVFIADLLTPVGVADYALYMGPVAMCVWSGDRRLPVVTAAVASILTVVGYFLSPGMLISGMAGAGNRAIGIIAIWSVALIVRRGIDLSTRVREEAALRANADERVSALVSSAMDAIISVNGEQRIVLFNPAAEAMFGRRAAEVLGQPIDILIPVLFHAAHRRHVAEFGSTGSTSRQMGALGAVSGVRADSTEFPVEASISQIQIRGEYLFTVILRDISTRLRDEAALRETTEELARSNVELERFAYVASHDLQEPLRAVSGCVQLLARRNEGRLDDQSQELVGHVVAGASRMQTLINDLLTFSRVGTRGLPRQRVSSRALVDTALANLAVAVSESGAEVEIGDLPEIAADPTQTVQVLQNLIGNALKFRGAHALRVRVSAAPDGACWRFSVADNGIGIAPEYHERIFDIFQRLHTRTEYPGTGIGLAICRKVIERHGGRIWVESATGLGSTFHFTLPGVDSLTP